MKRFSVLSVLFVFLMMFAMGCSGKSTGLEGKVVDGKGQPLASVKVAAKMSQPIKGYEQFETTTGSDGSFKFSKLFPTSEYQLIFYSERWVTEKKIKTESGPEGETKILPEPVMIRFMDDPKKGVVLDTQTGLMWANKDNGSCISWINAKQYCESYRGGGYTDWRMPTLDELVGLCIKSGKGRNGLHITDAIQLAQYARTFSSELRVDPLFKSYRAVALNFDSCNYSLLITDGCWDSSVLPVRSAK